MKCSLIAFNCRYSHSCLALFYVRNLLARKLPAGRIELDQFTINDPYYEVLLLLTAKGARYYFFSAYIWNGSLLERLIPDLAAARPQSRFIIGGPQARFLKLKGSNVTRIYGEVEGLGDAFYNDLHTGNLKPDYGASAGHDHEFPYIEADFQAQLANRTIYYEASRGCPFQCSYCLSSTSVGVVARDLQLVEKELQDLFAHRPREIRFVDRTFNVDPERTLRLWNFLARHQGETMLHFEMAPDRFTPEMLVFLEKLAPGRFQFEIGIQTTNPQALAAVNRRMDIEAALKNIATLAAGGNIHIHTDLILGLPYETCDTWKQSFNDLFACQPQHIQMGLLKVLPETALASGAEDFGLVCCRQPPYQLLATRWMNHDELQWLYWHGECVEAFYNNRYFRTLFRHLAESRSNTFAVFGEILEICRKRNFFRLARTQKLMTEIFSAWIDGQPDQALLGELLVFDWLRCGHRYLPDCLGEDSLLAHRNRLFLSLPENIPNLYTHSQRNEFFKSSIFYPFSGRCLRILNLDFDDNQHGDLAFLSERSSDLFLFQKVVRLPASQ